MKMNFHAPYGTVHGHPEAAYEQDGVLYDGVGLPLGEPKPRQDVYMDTNELNGARMFLTQVLKGGPLSKATVYKAAGENNQPWPSIKSAAEEMKIVIFNYKNAETWKLNEEA